MKRLAFLAGLMLSGVSAFLSYVFAIVMLGESGSGNLILVGAAVILVIGFSLGIAGWVHRFFAANSKFLMLMGSLSALVGWLCICGLYSARLAEVLFDAAELSAYTVSTFVSFSVMVLLVGIGALLGVMLFLLMTRERSRDLTSR